MKQNNYLNELQLEVLQSLTIVGCDAMTWLKAKEQTALADRLALELYNLQYRKIKVVRKETAKQVVEDIKDLLGKTKCCGGEGANQFYYADCELVDSEILQIALKFGVDLKAEENSHDEKLTLLKKR